MLNRRLRAVWLMSRLSLLAVIAWATPALAQPLSIPSDGSDGVFNPGGPSIVVDLSQAPSGHWSTPGNGSGVYDPDQWAVVFKYSSVNVPAGTTVTFTNHPSGAPVIWLVQGDVLISGTVNLNGATGHSSSTFPRTYAHPGPGGFRGGRGSAIGQSGSGGFGVGGGHRAPNIGGGAGGSYATSGAAGAQGALVGTTYGNVGVFPLIGGSGGGGGTTGASSTNASGGGGGGGAILIAASSMIRVQGSLLANGGSVGSTIQTNHGGGGSGGGIRLVAQVISGDGTIAAQPGLGGTGTGANAGGNGGHGRIRVEGDSIDLTGSTNPAASLGQPNLRFFRESSTPIIRAASIGGRQVPTDPAAGFEFPADVQIEQSGVVPMSIVAENVPPNAAVTVRITPTVGPVATFNAVFVGGNTAMSSWEAMVDVSNGFSAVQIRAELPAPTP